MELKNIKIPNHLAIIMDGNGRWAQERNLKRTEGHKEGSKTLNKVAIHAMKRGVKVFSVFAFSTENFNRSEEEVNYLMNLFVTKFISEIPFFNKNNVKVIFSGREYPLKKDVINSMKMLMDATKDNNKLIFNICLNYGGQSEIVDACKKIARDVIIKKMSINDIDENSFNEYLYNNLPPIDLLIRTSGEERVSNFMLYQLSYAEMYFPRVYFPDFDEEELDKAFIEYTNRDRRFGRIIERGE
jgi:undecaprenyl diphosphate synthase